MVAPSVAQVLQRELGSPNATAVTGYAGGWEETAELRFPYNQVVYDRMRKTWSQGQALVRGATMPVLGTNWSLRGRTVRPEVHALVERELGLQLDEEGRRRPREGGVSWDDFLRHAMLHGPLGFMPFELVTEPGPPDPGVDVGLPIVQHLVKIDPRFPRSLIDIVIERDGSFGGVRQQVYRTDPRFPGSSATWQTVLIPASSMVMFVNEREGADWYGQSWLRASYKHWLINDMLYRVGALAVDRTGMGLPVVTYPKGGQAGDRNKALAIASNLRAGEDSGVALEEGWTLELVGVTGSIADPLPQIKEHDQAAGRGMMQMFMNLGHDRGSQSLGETFLDVFLLAEKALIRYVEEVVTEQVIRRLVAWNYGPDEPYPTLHGDDPTINPLAVASAMSTLASAGLVYTDAELRGEVRRRLGLPAEGPDARAVTITRTRGTDGDPNATGGAPGATTQPAGVPAALPTVLDRRGVDVTAGAPVGARVAGGNVQPGVVARVVASEQLPIVVTLASGAEVALAPSDVQVVGRGPIALDADPRVLTGAQLAAHARALADRLEREPVPA